MKRNKLFYMILFFIIISRSFPVTVGYSAGNKSLKSLKLDEALKIALKNNHDYAIAALKLGEAKENVNKSWGQLMPALESEAALSRQYAENGMMSLSDGQYDIKLIQLKFGINPGYFYNSLQLAQTNYVISKQDMIRIKSNMDYNVIRNYFDLLVAEEMIVLRKNTLSVLKANLKDVKNLYRTGTVPKYELLQAQVKLKSQEPLVLEAETNYQVALDTFNYYLGNDKIIYCADRNILNENNYKHPSGDFHVKLTKLEKVALKNRPEILQLAKNKEVAEYSKKMNRSYYIWPTFSVSGYYGKSKYMPNDIDVGLTGTPVSPDFSQISGTNEWQNTWKVQVAATYRWGTLFSTDPVQAQERKELIRIKEANEELNKLKRTVNIAIRANYLNLLTAYKTIKSQKENVVTAREGLRIAEESYKNGIIKNSELLDAELSLTTAKTSYINAINNYYRSLAKLKKEIGVDDEDLIFKGDE